MRAGVRRGRSAAHVGRSNACVARPSSVAWGAAPLFACAVLVLQPVEACASAAQASLDPPRTVDSATLAAPRILDDASGERVVLLHGLGRSGRAMGPLSRRVEAAGREVHVVSYASTSQPLDELADALDRELAACCADERLHFVTHSMGGIVLRTWMARHESAAARIGRVVMLSPPNHGSELVDVLGRAGGLLGPSGRRLGTDPASAPNHLNALGPVDYELGVIAGTRSWSFLTSWILDGPDDGTVSVASARIPGMRDFLEHPASHTRLIYDREVARQVLHFLAWGRFDGSGDPAH